MTAERRVLKFKIPVDDSPHEVEFNGRIVHVDCQGNQPDEVVLWVESWTPSVITHTHTFRVFGTGQPIPQRHDYVGTALALGGALVWHLYQEQRR